MCDFNSEEIIDKISNSNARLILSPKPAGKKYIVGDEVVLNGENFFVIYDDGKRIKLLAKYCLKKDGKMQTDKNSSFTKYGRRFSYTNYWSDNIESNSLDLQEKYLLSHLLEKNEENACNNAIKTAQKYGEWIAKKTGKTIKGRLMTYDEATVIVQNNSMFNKSKDELNKIKKILFGKWNSTDAPVQGYLVWWLGTARSKQSVWNIDGSDDWMYGNDYADDSCGVRPVLEIH